MRRAVLWTAGVLVAAALVAVEAVWSLVQASHACFLGYPAVPCPDIHAAAVIRLTAGAVALPLVWGLGVALLLPARSGRPAPSHEGDAPASARPRR